MRALSCGTHFPARALHACRHAAKSFNYGCFVLDFFFLHNVLLFVSASPSRPPFIVLEGNLSFLLIDGLPDALLSSWLHIWSVNFAYVCFNVFCCEFSMALQLLWWALYMFLYVAGKLSKTQKEVGSPSQQDLDN